MSLSFDELAEIVLNTQKAVQRNNELLERYIEQGNTQTTVESKPDIMTIEEVAAFLNKKKNTIYKYTANNKIPFRKLPGSSTLVFFRSEIECYRNGSVVLDTNPVTADAVVRAAQAMQRRGANG